MKPSQRPLFVARRNYRSRRVRDGARLLPFLGLFLVLLPPLQQWDTAERGLAQQGLYVFSVWLFLIITAFLLSWRLRRTASQADPEERS